MSASNSAVRHSPEPQDPRLTAFDLILELARSMDAQAVDGDWVAVGVTERERDRAIHSFFSSPAAVHEVSWIASGIQELLEIDQRIMALARQRMVDLSGNIGELRKGRRAQRAYEANSSPAGRRRGA